jgi:preprotein translocase subunit SecG
MTVLIVVLHVIISLFLILVVLVQQGRRGSRGRVWRRRLADSIWRAARRRSAKLTTGFSSRSSSPR